MEKLITSPNNVLLTETQIRERIRELGNQISKDYADQELVLVCVLRGATLFFADLAREISVPLRFEFLQVSSYNDSTQPSKDIDFIRTGSAYIEHRNVLIVEDIIDTGQTISFLLEQLKPLNPRSLKICTLLNKLSRRQVPVHIDYAGFEVPNVFLVGYGLDYAQMYRNLPYIAVIQSSSNSE